jgi:hypothetical protein
MPPSKTIAANRLLELSQLTPQALQREGMGTDVDMNKFVQYLSSQVRVDLVERVIDATFSRSIDASTALVVTVNDYDRTLLTSGLLSNKLDVELDGLWFRLRSVDKNGDELVLTFEDREIAVLRTYSKWKKARRSKVTRAEFILNLIREVKEFTIPVVIPELTIVQPMESYTGDLIGFDTIINKTKGVNITPGNSQYPNLLPGNPLWKDPSLTVKGSKITQDQRTNANIILAVGEHFRKTQNVRRKVFVCAIMCAIQENDLQSNISSTGTQDSTSAGLFQMLNDKGTVDQRTDPEFAATWYFNTAIPIDRDNPNLSFNDLCWHVEGPAVFNRGKYGQWQNEADKIVSDYGITGGVNDTNQTAANGSNVVDPPIPSGNGSNTTTGSKKKKTAATASGDYYFWRGDFYDIGNRKYRKPENSWSCIQRLAKEVNWRAFFVSGTFYYLSEDDMLSQQPMMILNEFADGITEVDGSYDNNAKTATLTIQARVGRWSVPPGSVIVAKNMGPWNGRWIVSQYDRSLFDLNATITCTKIMPALPEPLPGGQQYEGAPSWPNAQPNYGAGAGQILPNAPGIPEGDRVKLAQTLLQMYKNKKWTDDNGGGLSQIQITAKGQQILNPGGTPVWLDPKTMQAVLYLISIGYQVGTYAWCTDHSSNDGMTGHWGGHAVDIDRLNGNYVNTDAAGSDTVTVDRIFNSQTINGYTLPTVLKPRQLISGGFGGHADTTCRSLTIPQPAVGYYGETTMSEHENHIHVGY